MTQVGLTFAAGFLLRVFEVVVESSLYLLIGLLTAGALRALVEPGRIRRAFGTGRISAPLRAWLAATMLLPACSLGVLPVLAELRRAKVPRHAVLTFALAAPMLNPISLVGGISYLGPNLLIMMLVGTMLVSVGAGIAVGPGAVEAEEVAEGMAPPRGSGRLVAAAMHAARAATGPVGIDLAVGLVGAGAIAASLSPSFLADSLFARDPGAIPRMAWVAPLSYATPEKGVATIPEMLKFRQSAGAMFLLVALGVGMTLGHASWAWRNFGAKVAARWLGAAVALALVLAVAIEVLTPPVGTANADNDHFNEFANPFRDHDGRPDLAGAAARFDESVEPFRWGTVGVLAALVVAGVACRVLGWPRVAIARPAHASGLAPAFWDRPLSPRLGSAAGTVVLAGLAVVGVYAYFPPPAESFRDMGIIKADFFGELGGPTLDPARHHLDLWERQASKLRIGSLIRFGPGGDSPRRATEELQTALQALRKSIEAGRRDDARAYSFTVAKIQDRCRRTYQVP